MDSMDLPNSSKETHRPGSGRSRLDRDESPLEDVAKKDKDPMEEMVKRRSCRRIHVLRSSRSSHNSHSMGHLCHLRQYHRLLGWHLIPWLLFQ